MIIAIPVAWYAIDKWLEAFTYKTNVSWWVFAMTGLATIVIAFITICLQAIKVAIASPVKSLRTE
jgi:putative ABC transport system permease protein